MTDQLSASTAGAASLYEGNEPYAFISYKHEDMPRIQAYLDFIQGLGFRIWYDRGIVGGHQWAGVIEDRLRSCRLFILFLSQAAVDADFVRKEVNLAVSSAKPLLVIRLEKLEMRHGMGLMLQDRQMLDSTRQEISAQIELSLRSFLTPVPDEERVTPAPPGPAHVTEDLAVGAGRAAQSIGSGLSALAQLMLVPQVRGAVDHFQADFAAASERVGKLGDYKDLHDLLHTLQFQCFYPLVQETRNPSTDPDWDNVDDYALTLQNVCEEIVRLVSRGAVPPDQTVRHQQLLQAGGLLSTAIDQHDVAKLRSAISQLRRVLDVWPSLINARLNEAAGHLRLPALEQAMRGIYEYLAPLNLDAEQVHQFGDGVEALNSLSVRLTTLVADHAQWQTVDVELRQVESQSDLADLVLAWPMLKSIVDTLRADCAEQWAISLGIESGKLEGALDANDPVVIRQAFRRFRRQADDRFYRVDVMLKRLCDDLRQVGEPLAAVLKVIG